MCNFCCVFFWGCCFFLFCVWAVVCLRKQKRRRCKGWCLSLDCMCVHVEAQKTVTGSTKMLWSSNSSLTNTQDVLPRIYKHFNGRRSHECHAWLQNKKTKHEMENLGKWRTESREMRKCKSLTIHLLKRPKSPKSQAHRHLIDLTFIEIAGGESGKP